MVTNNKIAIKKNNLYNNTIKTGSVLYVKYLLLKEDEIKISSFIGLCVVKKKSLIP